MFRPGKQKIITNLLVNFRSQKRNFENTKKFEIASILLISCLLVTSCSGKSVQLPDPKVKIYLLDLSGSGDVTNQFRLIQEDLITDLTSNSLGSPYEIMGPSITKFYFVGTNSRALREFSLQDQKIAYELFKYVDAENNDTRTENFWRLLSEKYQNYMIDKLEIAQTVTKDQCLREFDSVLKPTWDFNEVREVYSSFMCRMATYSLFNYEELKRYIASESLPGAQKASDVFGSLSKIDTQIEKFQNEYPNSKIKVILATDGDHNLGANSPSNLRSRIESASDLCALAEEYRQEFQLQGLVENGAIEIDFRGISALKNGTGEYPRQLESFWKCFFPTN